MRYVRRSNQFGFGAPTNEQIAQQIADDIAAQQPVQNSASGANWINQHPTVAIGAGFLLMMLLLRGRKYR